MEYGSVALNCMHGFCGLCRILPLCLTITVLTRGFPATPENSRYFRTGAGNLASIPEVIIGAGDIFPVLQLGPDLVHRPLQPAGDLHNQGDQRGLIDVTPVEVITARDEVQFVAEPAVEASSVEV